MASRNARVKEIFLDAVEIGSPDARAAFLDDACAGDDDLRRRVDALIEAHEYPESLLDRAAVSTRTADPSATTDPTPIVERPGTQIGPYKLLEQIGEGGMGVVFMAEQTAPVRRRVALKVIKPGMDTRQVVARFEAERQALAMMDHPNIARVLDAGATGSGRPYFVMELVRGVPITDYCDREKLPLKGRLDLFVQVCKAVQHAHQKGVIHRDIKPTNVLITLHDGVPVPKVIDFGVAKATGGSLTEKTLFTGFAQLVGTPLYMSPEQAEMSGLDVDTRSDIYSLGVLLYELLTGTTPFSAEALKRAAFDEMRRIIREEQPPTPSTRLSALGATSSTVSANRGSDPRRLGQLMRGELDWIVMKALEKDRRRRYETANGLAADVMRHLADEPVQACPPSAWYRFGKFARRNRAALTTVASVSVLLIAGTAFSAWQAVRATRAERRAGEAMADARRKAEEMRQVVDYLARDVFGAAAPEKSHGKAVTVLDILAVNDATIAARFRYQPLVEAAIRLAVGESYHALGQDDRAAPHVARVVEIRARHLGPEHPETLVAEAFLANVLRNFGYKRAANYEDAERIARHVFEARRRALGLEHEDTLSIMTELSVILNHRGRLDEALALAERALATQAHRPGSPPTDEVAMRRNLADVLHSRKELGRAEDLMHAVVEDSRRIQGPDHPHTLIALQGLGSILHARGRTAEARRVLQDNYDRTRRVFGIDSLRTASAMNRLASVTMKEGGVAAVRGLRRHWLREYLATPPEHDPYWRYRRSVMISYQALALVTQLEPEPSDTALALQGAERAVAIDGQWDWVYTVLGIVHCRLGDLTKAEEAIRASMERPKWKGGCGNDWWVLALIHARRGDMATARAWYQRGLGWDGPEKAVWRENFLKIRDEAAALLGEDPRLGDVKPRALPETKGSPG